MKKILIFINSMQPAGGIERVVSTLSSKLSAQYEVTILVKDEPCSFYPLNPATKLKSLGNKLSFDMKSRFRRVVQVVKNLIFTVSRLRCYLKQNSYDYYYVTHPLSVLEFALAGVESNKLIISEHGSRSAYNVIYRLIKFLLYKRCLKYVVPTKSDTTLYDRSGYPAVYIPHFRPDLPYSPSDGKSKIVLNIGRFTADKQQLVLLELWHKVVKEANIQDWVLHIVGSGELEKTLHSYVENNGLGNHVKFLPPSQNIAQYYESASIFALTSKYEGFGMVLLEAISFGIPCVSFDCPSGPRDIIASNINGYLVELNNITRFAEALTTLIQEESSRIQMSKQAFILSQNWKDDVILESWYKIFRHQ